MPDNRLTLNEINCFNNVKTFYIEELSSNFFIIILLIYFQWMLVV